MNVNAPQSHGGFVLPGMKRKPTEAGASVRIPGLGWLPDALRNHFIAMAGEFVGTFLFLFFAFSGTQVANTQTQGAGSTTISQAPNPAQLLYISLCFGFSLAVNAWVFFRISGGLFNPAVSFGMCLIGAVPWLRGGLIIISQLLAAIASAAVVEVLFPGPLNVRTSLGGGTSITQGLFIEMFLTAQLVVTIFLLAAEKSKATFIAPIGIGLSLFIAELTGVYYTGGSLNPARTLGPCVVLRAFETYHWIYWVGPLLGTLLACGFYKFIKVLEYETANPGQDIDDREAQVYDPEKDIRPPVVSLAPSRELDSERPQSGDSRRGKSRGNDSINYHRHNVRQEPPHSPQRESRRDPTYPPVDGTAIYDDRRSKRNSGNQERRSKHGSGNSYRSAGDAEAGVIGVPGSAGRYMPRSAGYT